ncbi:AMP-binding protein [Rhodococcus koreensis]
MLTVTDRYSPDEIADYYRQGVWLEESFFDMVERQAAARGGDRFIFDDHDSLTFEEFRRRALRLAHGLHSLGVGAGVRVAVQLPNWTEFAVAAAALSRIGGIIVPIMPIFRDDEVQYVLDHSGAQAAITCEIWKDFSHAEMFARLRDTCPALTEILIARSESDCLPAGLRPLDELFDQGDLERLESELGNDTAPDQGFLIVYTSGTTARPKGCYHTVNTVRASAIAIAESLDYTAGDVQFGPSPITHSTGLMTSVILPLLVGAQSYLMDQWNPDDAVTKVSEHRCSVTVTATAFLQMHLAALDSSRDGLGSLRQWICAGSPVPGSVVERARHALPGCQILSLYGRSESFLNAMCASDDAPELSATTDGKPRGGARLRVVDLEGREVERGQVGDIAYRGPSHMLEYFRDPEQTRKLFTGDGYARSGDLGYMNDQGYVRVTGRTKDIVIRGGLNISARELEDLLTEHPQIRDVAIVGMPDQRLGEKVCAYIVPTAGQPAPRLEDIVSYLRSKQVATPKLPQRLEIVDTFPVTATGKIKKHELRDDIAGKLLAEQRV